ncbi:MAG: hypothetical protein Q9225_000959 [Loekoesia sp. 1 TL-2023]
MSELDQFLFSQPLGSTDMETNDLSSFEEQLAAYEGRSTFDSSAIGPFLIGDAASMLQASNVERSTSQSSHLEENPETSIDPSLLTTFDTSLDPLTSLPSLKVTEASIFDPSTGAEWQPMNNLQTSIDPTLLSPFDIAIDPFAAQSPFASNEVIFPSESIESIASNTTAAFSPEVPSLQTSFLQPSSSRTTAGQPAKSASSSLRHPTTRSTPRWYKTTQPRVDGSGCPCTLCKGGAVSTASLRNNNVKQATRKIRKPVASGKVTKRKARAVTSEEDESEDSDSSLSSLPDSEDEESGSQSDHNPRPTTRRSARAKRAPPQKRRRVMRKATALRKVPKGLEIDMEGW